MNTSAINDILRDPAASHWLKGSLTSALKRDALDAARDANRLAEVLSGRLAEMQRGQRSQAQIITAAGLFEFLLGWDFQPVQQREQVIHDFFNADPDYVQMYGEKDWNDLPAHVRESLFDECNGKDGAA